MAPQGFGVPIGRPSKPRETQCTNGTTFVPSGSLCVCERVSPIPVNNTE